MMVELDKCSHVGCGCDVIEEDSYCCAYCSDSESAPDEKCTCGHAGCNAQ
jgi:hypothetical protein